MKRWRLPLILVVCFGCRLLFGLSREFFFEDETQIFLIGFRYYATAAWPFFGPDVVWTRSEIPGALQGLLVGVPLQLLAIPESPYVLLNLLSFAAICALSWYACEHLPGTPRWLIWGWFLTIPWTIQFSAHLINTSYILAPAIVFFLGFFEAIPSFSLRRIPAPVAFGMMGLAVTWLLQIHMSWPLLLPFAAAAWLLRAAEDQGQTRVRSRSDPAPGGRVRSRSDPVPGERVGSRSDPAGLAPHLAVNAAAFIAGALIPGAVLLPTLARYGLNAGSGGVLRNLHPHWVSPWIIATTLARFLSFGSLEVVRFIATDNAKRLEFFQRHLWLAPAAVAVWMIGTAQPIWMFIDLCRPARRWPALSRVEGPASPPQIRWATLRVVVAASVLLVYTSYWFVMEPPQAHAFYVLAPIAFMVAAYWWTFVDSPRARRIAAGVLVLNVAYHAGLAWSQGPELSLYKNRGVVATAVRLKEPEMFAHRRDFAIGGGPAVLSDLSRPYDPTRDFQVLESAYRMGPQRSLHWTMTLRNASAVVAYRDPLYVASYLDERGALVEERHERIKDIFQPGETRIIDLNDGFAGPPFAKASLRIVAAEALLPVPKE